MFVLVERIAPAAVLRSQPTVRKISALSQSRWHGAQWALHRRGRWGITSNGDSEDARRPLKNRSIN
eukprot:6840294-Heterocapsa_arctica.AAC.1